MTKLKSLILLSHIILLFPLTSNAQIEETFLLTKGPNNISTITMGSASSPHCSIIEYPEFLVLHEIPNIPSTKIQPDTIDSPEVEVNPLIVFIDSVYQDKPIKYILNSHHHRHSLSVVTPFLEKGAKLITSQNNIALYDKWGLFGDKTSMGYSESIIQISADTTLLADTSNPIEVLYLKKSDYSSIPTETYLFFNFPKQKLLATSCMVYLKDIEDKYGYKAIVYNDRIVNVNQIIADKNLKVDNTLQLYRFKTEDGLRLPPIFPISHLQNVLKLGWHREALSEHLQNMSYEELNTKKDSLLNYFGENDIYHIVINHAVYSLIEKREYKKAIALAHILVIYEPGNLDEMDTLGEAYFNNGQLAMAKHYDQILKKSKQKSEGLGLVEWEKNQRKRLEKGG